MAYSASVKIEVIGLNRVLTGFQEAARALTDTGEIWESVIDNAIIPKYREVFEHQRIWTLAPTPRQSATPVITEIV